MPKVKLNKKVPPPVDWLWALVLERKATMKLSVKDMAEVAGVSYTTMRNYAGKSPWDWPRPMRERMCKELGIKVTMTPTVDGLEVRAE